METRLVNTRPWLYEAQNYNLADYPSVEMNFRCDETSGLFILDEAGGIKLQAYQEPDYTSGSLSFDGPAYSVTYDPAGAQPPILEAPYPTILSTRIYIMVMVFRSRNSGIPALPSGSNSLNGEIAFGTRQGMHITVSDGVSTVSAVPDSTRKVTAGNDYVYLVFLRPSGQNYEHRLYNLDGTIATDSVSGNQLTQTVANTGLGDITPTPIAGGSAQADWYQKILYGFNTEPSAGEILTMVQWHGYCAPVGIKGPFPGWRGR